MISSGKIFGGKSEKTKRKKEKRLLLLIKGLEASVQSGLEGEALPQMLLRTSLS